MGFWDEIDGMLVDAVSHYAKSAPTVSRWANDLYERLRDDPDHVRVGELHVIEDLWGGGSEPTWMHPNTAANRVYKLMSRLGQDTTGHAGF